MKSNRIHFTDKSYESYSGKTWYPLFCGWWKGVRAISKPQNDWTKVTCPRCLKRLKGKKLKDFDFSIPNLNF